MRHKDNDVPVSQDFHGHHIATTVDLAQQLHDDPAAKETRRRKLARRHKAFLVVAALLFLGALVFALAALASGKIPSPFPSLGATPGAPTMVECLKAPPSA